MRSLGRTRVVCGCSCALILWFGCGGPDGPGSSAATTGAGGGSSASTGAATTGTGGATASSSSGDTTGSGGATTSSSTGDTTGSGGATTSSSTGATGCTPDDAATVCDDQASCTIDGCDAAGMCAYTPVASGVPCAEAGGKACNGLGACVPGGYHLWSKVFGGPDSDFNPDIAISPSGEIVFSMYSSAMVDLGGGPLPEGIVVAKLDADGNHLFSKSFPGLKPISHAPTLAVTSTDEIVFVGHVSDDVDFGGGTLAGSSTDMFVVKLDAAGDHLWSRRFGLGLTQEAQAVAVGADGSVVLVGNGIGSIDFGGGTLTAASFLDDIFIAKLDASGDHVWSKRLGGDGDDDAYGVAIDGAGDVLVTGTIDGSVDLGGGLVGGAQLKDIFVVKLDASGNHLWSKGFGNASSQPGFHRITTDGQGNVLLTGRFEGVVDFGGGPLNGGLSSSFTLKLDPSGKHVFSRNMGAGTIALGDAATSGEVVVAGSFYKTIDVGGGPLPASPNDGNLYVAKYDAAGNHIWSERFTNGHELERIEIDGMGNILIVGQLSKGETVDFGGGPLQGVGSSDVFLVKLAP